MTENWYDTLNKKRAASGVMLFDEDGRLLIVKPGYKDEWSLVGGCVDANESPRDAAIREVKEEIGINLTDVTLRCMDYTSRPASGESYQFVFDGGILSKETIASIQLDPSEIAEYAFYPIEEAVKLLSDTGRNRIKTIFGQKNPSSFIYLEQGKVV